MKAIVEWGRPRFATHRRIVGTSGSYQVANRKQAAVLAKQLFFSLTEEQGHPEAEFLLTGRDKRKGVWNADRSFWVCVSLLDGVPRGAYAGIAEREASACKAIASLRTLADLYALWDQLTDVPVNEASEVLDAAFLHFPAGTEVHAVWHWFEAQNRRFVVGDVQQGIRIEV